MNYEDRLDLERLKKRQVRLAADLAAFQQDLQRFEERIKAVGAPEPEKPEAPLPPLAPPIITSVIASASPSQQIPEPTPVFSQTESTAPPEEEVVISPQATVSPEAVATPLRLETVSAPEPAPFHPPPLMESTEPPPESRSFELQLGTYWFVRIGIVLVLTALAFFGNYAYQNYVANFGKGAKVALMYVASGLILGAGAWLQRRKGKESLRNYAQVLFAGGLAAVYFTTYAAHHIERLRIIESVALDGVLLLAWTGFIVWLADRRKSEILALFAIGLAYYTSFITRTGSFTLYSNVLLTAAAVFFLWRNRWAIISFVSLPATYGAYAFWRFYVGQGWRFPTAEEGLFFSSIFLGAYWVLFTAAVFLSRHESFRETNRTAFLSFNNGAALGLFLLTMAQLETGGLWKVLLVFGTTLIVLGVLARHWLSDDPLVEHAYLTQGLVLVTAGVIAKFSGLNLALMLAAESVILLELGARMPNRILRFGGFACAFLATAWVLDDLNGSVRESLYLGLGVAVAMLANAHREHQRMEHNDEMIRGSVAFFSILLLIVLGSLTWSHADRGDLAHLFLLQAALLTVSVHLLGIRELPVCSIGFVGLGHLAWLGNSLARAYPWDPWWQPALLLLITLGLIHWWSRQRAFEVEDVPSKFMQGVGTVGVVLLLYTWTSPYFDSSERHLFSAALSGMVVMLTLYSAWTRSVVLLVGAQWMLAPALAFFLWEVTRAQAPWYWLLVPGIAMVAISSWELRWAEHKKEMSSGQLTLVQYGTTLYRSIALATLAMVVAQYVTPANRPWVYALLSVPLFASAGLFKRFDLFLYSSALMACGLVAYLAPVNDSVLAHLPNLALIAAILIQQRAARRMPERFPVHDQLHALWVVTGGVLLWIFISRYVQQHATGFLLTVSWSVLAFGLLGLGMICRERAYRWFGLFLIAASLGRIAVFDVWKLHTLYRILSFLALGIVLLVLGYIYNKYQEKIRQWL